MKTRQRKVTRVFALALLGWVSAQTPGCATLREVAALRDVNFSIAGVGDVRLAGIDLSRVGSYEDLNLVDAGRLATALVKKDMPLEFELRLQAENPAGNSIDARLVQMDWTLLLQDKETIHGTVDRAIVLQPGQPRDVPIGIKLDLLDFFEGHARDLVDLTLAMAGESATPQAISLRAVPTIETALGPIRYPQPITIVRREFGG